VTVGERVAAIDVGTNTVLLLVAERGPGGPVAVRERAEITRLGRGVDATGRLDAAAVAETVGVLAAYAAEARALGAARIACVATSAARDAANGADFFAAARRATGLEPAIISGDEEARLVWRSAWRDFGGPASPRAAGGRAPGAPAGPARAGLVVLDVGGGSTEVCWGDGPDPRGRVSLQVGAVRLTERHVREDPLGPATLAALRQAARAALAPLAAPGGPGRLPGAALVGVAGTVTTLAAVAQALPAYDADRVHGSALAIAELEGLVARLAALPVAERRAVPGMEPKRADVIVAGGVVVAEAARLLGFVRLTVSDRGVRWGLVHDLLGA
jgi:exopolyphosphatase/guanosine-5'-triphosphate,3'-diphosphate pyrophosphatase